MKGKALHTSAKVLVSVAAAKGFFIVSLVGANARGSLI